MPRVHLPSDYSRDLPPAVIGWIKNHAARNHWRMAGWYDLDDLVQDGVMVAYKCRERYGTELDPPHFMALVKKAFFSHIGQLLRDGRPEHAVTDRIGDLSGERTEASFLDSVASEDPMQEFRVLLAEMPKSLRNAASLILQGRRPRAHLDGRDETEAEWLERLAGLPRRHDFAEELRKYLEAA